MLGVLTRRTRRRGSEAQSAVVATGWAAATGRDAAWRGRSTGRRGYSWPASWSARSPTSGWRRIRLSSLAAAAFAAALALMGGQPVATGPHPSHGGPAVEALAGPAAELNSLFASHESPHVVDSH